MKRITKISWLLMAFTLLALSACGGGAATAVDQSPIFTQIASTAQALQTQVAQAAAPAINIPEVSPTPAPTNTPEVPPTPEATNTPLITDTPAATNTPLPTPTNTPRPANTSAPANQALPTLINVSMDVTLTVNDNSDYSTTVRAGQALIYRAKVKNTGEVPLQVVANLTVPDGWDVDQDQFSDCPETTSLAHKSTCTISWYFTPQVSGQVTLRVYVRGIYKDAAGNTGRITESPAFIINVEPAKS